MELDADAPAFAVLTACGRAVEIPVAASALPAGHKPLAGFFRCAQPDVSTGGATAPLVCELGAVIVDVEVEEDVELLEAIDDEEFCRCTVLRGPGVNILLTSSELIAPKPLPLEVHPMRVLGWKDTAGATAVI